MNEIIYTPDMRDGKNVFVFGSNLAGRHGKGAALEARRYWGAVYGCCTEQPGGDSYGIPTKDTSLNALPLDFIADRVITFLVYANAHPNRTFLVTRIGCGLAGYTDEQIAPLFVYAPANCILPARWREILTNQPK